jgi:hypothetical protein
VAGRYHEYFDNPCEEDETEGNKKFQIDNTSIGKTDFQSINLSSFTEIKIFVKPKLFVCLLNHKVALSDHE